ncbi:hypothetical protein G7054_g3004 [Neopestalotiopsis clavispora]|nr:hypothetical protein G7054_g3004 [Neopestalotiopsis clavispora]
MYGSRIKPNVMAPQKRSQPYLRALEMTLFFGLSRSTACCLSSVVHVAATTVAVADTPSLHTPAYAILALTMRLSGATSQDESPLNPRKRREVEEDDPIEENANKRLCVSPTLPWMHDTALQTAGPNNFAGNSENSLVYTDWWDSEAFDDTLPLQVDNLNPLQLSAASAANFLPIEDWFPGNNNQEEGQYMSFWDGQYDDSTLVPTPSQVANLHGNFENDPVSRIASYHASDQVTPYTISDASFLQTTNSGVDSAETSTNEADELQDTSVSPESSIPDCDTCLGVIVSKTTASWADTEGGRTVPVDVVRFGNILKVCFQDTTKSYAGIIPQLILRKILDGFTISYKATLSQPSTSGKRNIGKKKDLGHSSKYKDSECEIRLVVFGVETERISVGRLLSDSDLFLQPPFNAECPEDFQYNNPHYLVQPGMEMPKLENLAIDVSEPDNRREIDELGMGWLQHIFDSSDAEENVSMVDLDPSPRLKTALLRYRNIITGEIRDKPSPIRGGVLADEMGLGKTLTVLGLICSSLDSRRQGVQSVEKARYTSTLIISPKSTLPGWQKQISEHIHPEYLKATLYYGSTRNNLRSNLLDYDVVMTTYETLRSEYKTKGPLFSHKWLRVVLDEGRISISSGLFSVAFRRTKHYTAKKAAHKTTAHHIRNRTTQIFQAACALQSSHRWCLTGTPIHNSLDDYGALLTFIGAEPFHMKSSFDSWIVSPFMERRPNHMENLKSLVHGTCIRRTKASSSVTITLPQVNERIENIELFEADQIIYDFFKKRTAEIASSIHRESEAGVQLKNKKGANILGLMSSLRLICDHGKDLLPDSALKLWQSWDKQRLDANSMLENQVYCESCGDVLESKFGAKSTSRGSKHPVPHLLCPTCHGSAEDDRVESDAVPQLISQEIIPGSGVSSPATGRVTTPSAKVSALLRNIREDRSREDQNNPSKSVIFSCWSRMLDLLEPALEAQGITFQRIDGQTSLSARSEALKQFTESPQCTIMLATIGSCGEGVNLTVAVTVHLLEPNWNPMIEAQAVDRVHRIGQARPVTIIRYIVPRSIETYIRDIQKDKISLISDAMSHSNSRTSADVALERWRIFQSHLEG